MFSDAPNPPVSLYLTSEIRRIEADAASLSLMERAGVAAAQLALSLIKDNGFPVLILAGPGNNGGDAFSVACHLKEHFFDVQVVFLEEEKKRSPEAENALQKFRHTGGSWHTRIPEMPSWSLIIDGLFGVGLKQAITTPYATLIEQANILAKQNHCPVLALDCPSGLDAETGQSLNPTISATHTLTFIGAKPGLYTADGPDYCGRIHTASLGMCPEKIIKPSGYIINTCFFSDCLLPRKRNSHKGLYGNAGLLGGSPSMIGALLLAARSALHLGCGRVYASLLDKRAPAVDLIQPELMFRSVEHLLSTDLSVLACGPGLEPDQKTARLLKRCCHLDIPLILDAGALSLLAKDKDLNALLIKRTAPTLLTPHPAEAANLLESTVSAVQSHRIEAALELAARYKAHVALKGCGTVVATPDRAWFINTTGNPALASAGSGDVLTGIATALLAQKFPPLKALLAAVHMHGFAADTIVAKGIGPVGIPAGDLIESARHCFNRWIREVAH